MATTVPHAMDVMRVMNRCNVAHRLVCEKILAECVNCILTAAKRGDTFTIHVIPCFKVGYPAYNIDEVRYYVLNQLLKKKFCAVPYKRNHLYIQWSKNKHTNTT